jgi:hypothetical protein
MSTNYTSQIDQNQCIGDSLDVLNSNFNNLDTSLTTLSTNFMSVSVAPFNTNVVTASAGAFIGYIFTTVNNVSVKIPYYQIS